MRLLFAALAGVAACHSPSPAPPPPAAAPLPSASAPIAIASATAAPSASAEAAVADAGPAWLDDPAAWFTARGAKPPPNLDTFGSCTEVHFGAREALSCSHGAPSESVPDGESVFPLRIVGVAGGKAVIMLEAPIVAGPLDNPVRPGQNADDFQYVVLEASLDDTGVTIHERPGKGCNAALAQYREREAAPHRRMIQRACSARGRYVLRGDKLVRESR